MARKKKMKIKKRLINELENYFWYLGKYLINLRALFLFRRAQTQLPTQAARGRSDGCGLEEPPSPSEDQQQIHETPWHQNQIKERKRNYRREYN